MSEGNKLFEELIKTQAAKDLEGLPPKLDHRMRGLLTPKQSLQYKAREHVFRVRTLKRALAFSVIALLFFSLGLELSPKFESTALPRVLAANYEQLEVVAIGSDDPLAMALQAAGLVYSTSLIAENKKATKADDSEGLALSETGLNTGLFHNYVNICDSGEVATKTVEMNTVVKGDLIKKIKANKEFFLTCYESGDERRPLTKRLRGPAALVVNTAGEIFVADRVSESQTVVYKITPTSYWLNSLLRSKDK